MRSWDQFPESLHSALPPVQMPRRALAPGCTWLNGFLEYFPFLPAAKPELSRKAARFPELVRWLSFGTPPRCRPLAPSNSGWCCICNPHMALEDSTILKTTEVINLSRPTLAGSGGLEFMHSTDFNFLLRSVTVPGIRKHLWTTYLKHVPTGRWLSTGAWSQSWLLDLSSWISELLFQPHRKKCSSVWKSGGCKDYSGVLFVF